MHTDIFTLCDRVQCYENKLMVIGAYDVISVQNTAPAPLSISIAARIRFEKEECGPSIIKIEASEVATGIKVLDIDNPIDIEARNPIGEGLLNVVLNDVPVLLPREGKYEFTLSVEGKANGTDTFGLHLVKVP
ncbi:MAG: hypothetical protein HDR80_00450 [Bacteroides sp.]|nr:hypothetical protein [Bacteroides sp.]